MNSASGLPWKRSIAAGSINKHDVCNIQYTSGTTGFPKGYADSLQRCKQRKMHRDCMDLSTADRMLIQVPMFHCFGMVLSMTAAVTHGAPCAPFPISLPSNRWIVNRENHLLQRCSYHVHCHAGTWGFQQTDFLICVPASWQAAPALSRWWRMWWKNEHVGDYHCFRSNRVLSLDVLKAHGWSLELRLIPWRPLPGSNANHQSETGRITARNGWRICSRDIILWRDIINAGGNRAAIDEDGWLHTRDLARRDDNGYFQITGRIRDMIIGAVRTFIQGVEDFIYTHPKVRDVQVIGVPDRQYGEEIMACVILKEGGNERRGIERLHSHPYGQT